MLTERRASPTATQWISRSFRDQGGPIFRVSQQKYTLLKTASQYSQVKTVNFTSGIKFSRSDWKAFLMDLDSEEPSPNLEQAFSEYRELINNGSLKSEGIVQSWR
jgi:hypothetical protein